MNKHVRTLMNVFLISCFMLYGLIHTPLASEVYADEQSVVTYENLSLYFMPHYHQPEDWEEESTVFIGVYGTLKNESTEETIEKIELPIIETDGAIHLELVGDLVDEQIEPIDAEVNEEKSTLSWEPNQAIGPEETYDFLAEYYIAIEESDNLYEIDLPYVLERDAQVMDILVFEPYNAENFEIKSTIEEVETTDQFGIQVHKLDLGEAKKDTTYDVQLRYEKRDTITTMEAIDRLKKQAELVAEASEEKAAEEESFFTVENIVLGAIALVVLMILIVVIIRNRRRQTNMKDEK